VGVKHTVYGRSEETWTMVELIKILQGSHLIKSRKCLMKVTFEKLRDSGLLNR